VIYEYNARLTRVVDGDTVWLDVDLGFGVHTNSDFRLFGIDTPEVIGATRAAGLAAKAELERLLSLGTLRIETHKGDESDKYGRWLANLYVLQTNGVELHVNALLVAGRFAKAYFGKGPKP
jgi:micrococcal nuclease